LATGLLGTPCPSGRCPVSAKLTWLLAADQ
jgi:hypothetical protein